MSATAVRPSCNCDAFCDEPVCPEHGVLNPARVCSERGCLNEKSCDICGGCEPHCPGHIGLRKTVGVKFGAAAREYGKTKTAE